MQDHPSDVQKLANEVENELPQMSKIWDRGVRSFSSETSVTDCHPTWPRPFRRTEVRNSAAGPTDNFPTPQNQREEIQASESSNRLITSRNPYREMWGPAMSVNVGTSQMSKSL
jgi:hypothetical protein